MQEAEEQLKVEWEQAGSSHANHVVFDVSHVFFDVSHVFLAYHRMSLDVSPPASWRITALYWNINFGSFSVTCYKISTIFCRCIQTFLYPMLHKRRKEDHYFFPVLSMFISFVLLKCFYDNSVICRNCDTLFFEVLMNINI